MHPFRAELHRPLDELRSRNQGIECTVRVIRYNNSNGDPLDT